MEEAQEGSTQEGTPSTTILTAEKDLQVDNAIASTAGHAALAGFGDLTNGILRYVTNVAMTHMVSPAIYGAFGEVYTAMIILGWIVKLGFDGVLVRLLPGYRVKDRPDLMHGLTRFSLWVTLGMSLLAGGIVFAAAAMIARLFYRAPSYEPYLKSLALLIPLTASQWVLAAALQAHKEIKWKVYVDRLSQPVITLATMVICYFLGWRFEALCLSMVAGYLCSVLIGQTALSRVLKRESDKTQPTYTPRIWLTTAIPMLFHGLIYGILNSADVLFLSVFATSTQAAIYIAADRVSSLVAMPLVALNIIFSPLIAEYHASERHEEMVAMLKLVTKWSLSLSLPVFLASLLFHDAILEIFGPQYTAGGLALAILCVGNIVNSGTGSVLQVLAMTGHLRVVSFNSIVTICVNAVLSCLLVPHVPVVGAALAAALTEVVLNVLCLIEVYWLMRVHPYRRDIYKPLLAGGTAFVVGLLLVHFTPLIAGKLTIFEELALLLPFGLVYCLVMLLLGFGKEEQIVLDMVRRRFRLCQS